MEMDAVLYVLSSEGGWKDGKEYEQGTYYTKNGDKYTGKWDGNYEGQREINYKDGNKYHSYSYSTSQFDEHPSPFKIFQSSHFSRDGTNSPSPHFDVQISFVVANKII